MKLIGMIFMVLLLAFAVSCGPTIKEGREFDSAKRSELIKGQTTEQEVLNILGTPFKKEKSPSGEPRYIYQSYYEEYVHWYTPSRYDKRTLAVDFKGGIVDNYLYTRETRGMITKEDK